MLRIIPARAGFTGRVLVNGAAHRDHPRSRGVYDTVGDEELRYKGSSPLARGLLVIITEAFAVLRIIPARAGFTRFCAQKDMVGTDHPRSRGVYLIPKRVPGGITRIIPARAGFTLADPWNPNDEPCYQTAFTFSANLEPAPPSSGSAVVLRRSTMTPSEA